MPDIEDDDAITFTEEHEISWRNYLTEFQEKVYPVFKSFGFTLPEAFAAWDANRITNFLQRLADADD